MSIGPSLVEDTTSGAGHCLAAGAAAGVFLSSLAWSFGLPLAAGGVARSLVFFSGLAVGLLAGAGALGASLALRRIASILSGPARKAVDGMISSRAFPLVIFILICSLAAAMALPPLLVYGNELSGLAAITTAFLVSLAVYLVTDLVLFNPRRRGAARILGALAFTAGALTGFFYLERAPAPRPRVVLVTIDTLRWDRVGCYGYPRGTTPFIDGLCAKGAMFSRAYCTTPVTDPAHSAMLTGLYPRTTGIIYNGYPAAIDLSASLARSFEDAGYATGAVTSRVHLDPELLGIPGFDYISSPTRRALDTPASEATRRAALWLRAHRREPVFLWVHYWDPHAPYFPPGPFREKFAPGSSSRGDAPVWLEQKGSLDPDLVSELSSLYDGEVAYVDSELRRLYGFAQSLFPDASRITWVVVGDHGEILGEFQDRYPYGFGHGEFLFEPAVRVPWIISGGWAGKGKIISDAVSTIDLAPTLLELAGLEPLEVCQGRSLARLLKGESRPEPAPVFLERWLPEGGPVDAARERMFAVVLGDSKWLATPSGAIGFYRPGSDPEERHIFNEQGLEGAESLKQLWEEFERTNPAAAVRRGDRLPVTAQDFRALGYFR